MQVPYDDPKLPSFEAFAYREMKPDLQKLHDAWVGKKAWYTGQYGVGKELTAARRYLPQETAEPDLAYQARLTRSLYNNTFKRTIIGFAGLLTEFQLSDKVPPPIIEWQDDVDLKGTTLRTFLKSVDCAVLRDGMAGIYVEYPKEPVDELGVPLIQDALAEKQWELRPYLIQIDRRDILNWKVRVEHGKYKFDRVTIREYRIEESADGEFGEEQKVYYRVIYPNSYVVYELMGDEYDTSVEVIEVERGENSLGIIPLVVYSVSETNAFTAESPMNNLADLGFSHYQLYSDYREVMRKCNLPVPVRKGMVIPGMPMDELPPPLVLGPNSAVDIPVDGDFFFAEPSGAALQTTREELIALERAMRQESLDFSTDDGPNNKTATEVELDSTQMKATIRGMAEMKESAVELVFSYWSMWLGGDDAAGSIEIDKDILDAQLEPNAITAIASLHTTGLMSRKSVLAILEQRGLMHKDFDLDAELAMTTQDSMLPQVDPNETEGKSDGGGKINADSKPNKA
jgi:hypothetical protein